MIFIFSVILLIYACMYACIDMASWRFVNVQQQFTTSAYYTRTYCYFPKKKGASARLCLEVDRCMIWISLPAKNT